MQTFYKNNIKDAMSSSKILLIGVGGIGCEILKYLTKHNPSKLHIVDMDIIELTNLNRQFYFKKQHIGHFKAETAYKILKKESPSLKINFSNKNIFCKEFDINFFKGFNLVIMALDNEEARSYVNKICYKAKVGIFEGGSTGFSGQSYVILPDLSRCYDCVSKPKKKSFAVCTIRTLPSKIEHCLVWGKNVFNNLGGEKGEFNICERFLDMKKKIYEGKILEEKNLEGKINNLEKNVKVKFDVKKNDLEKNKKEKFDKEKNDNKRLAFFILKNIVYDPIFKTKEGNEEKFGKVFLVSLNILKKISNEEKIEETEYIIIIKDLYNLLKKYFGRMKN